MTTYETLLITVPDLASSDESSLVGSLADIVTGGGGTMVVRERMGRRRLAYPIDKCDDGVYTLFLYDAEADVPRELERRARLSDKVLRFLTVRLEKQWAGLAKEKALRDAEARAQAEVARAAALEKAKAEAAARAEEAAKSTAQDAASADAAGATEAPAKPAEDDGKPADAAPADAGARADDEGDEA